MTDRLAVVASCLDRVEAIGTSGKEQLERAKKEVVEGMSFLARRQKLIKLADRSESGWAVVEEYDADTLADNSDDERKIEKAEKSDGEEVGQVKETAGGEAKRRGCQKRRGRALKGDLTSAPTQDPLCGAQGWRQWGLLYPTNGEWVSFVTDYGMLPLSEGLIRPGRMGSAVFGGKFPNTTAIALRVNFEYDSQGVEPRC